MSRIPVRGEGEGETWRLGDADRRAQRRSWQFDRRISLDTIVGIAGIAIVVGGPFIVWGRAMEGRVLAIEVRDEARSQAYRDIKDALEKLSAQMTQQQIALGIITGTSPPKLAHPR